jgi:hypothetical protein
MKMRDVLIWTILFFVVALIVYKLLFPRVPEREKSWWEDDNNLGI